MRGTLIVTQKVRLKKVFTWDSKNGSHPRFENRFSFKVIKKAHHTQDSKIRIEILK